jgi:hypothetical protein
LLTSHPVTSRLPEAGPAYAWQLGLQESPHRATHSFFVHFILTHAHPRRTFQSVTHRSKPSTLNFVVFRDVLPEKKLQLVGMSILINPIKHWAGMSRTPPLRRSTSSSINPKLGTFSLGHVRGSSVSACAMPCDHLGPTPAMHTMLAQLRPHAPVKPRESALILIVTTRLPKAGPTYTWQLSRTPRISSQTNTCLFCALYPHSCTPGKNFRVGHPSLQAKHA